MRSGGIRSRCLRSYQVSLTPGARNLPLNGFDPRPAAPTVEGDRGNNRSSWSERDEFTDASGGAHGKPTTTWRSLSSGTVRFGINVAYRATLRYMSQPLSLRLP